MNDATAAPDAEAVDRERILKIAIMALGGQGGGVLTNWITELAEANGFRAQATSVAGVAQRTGATIYYIEMSPRTDAAPVYALSPSPGDVDVMIAAEMMEAGRAIMRGFVTPGRTTMIASTHRALATSEKTVPGDGLADSPAVEAAAASTALTYVGFDMEDVAAHAGSVISASLFGALAGSGALPFAREAYEATIRASGRGVKASLAAFVEAFERAAAGERSLPPQAAKVATPDEPVGPEPALAAWRGLVARIEAMPEPVREMARRGLVKVVDFQDTGYGGEYLDRLDRVLAADRAAGGETRGFELTATAAKYVANAMAYDDVIRVADLKTRSGRFSRVRREIGVGEDHVLHITEFMHPRGEEFCAMMPARLGRWIESRPRLLGWIDRRINRGRRVRTDGIVGFSMLYVVGGLRPWRRRLRRHEVEAAHIERWLDTALSRAPQDYALAVEVLRCRRLIKGYSDTHARGLSKFDRVLSALPLVEGRADAADWVRRLREAALRDEKGEALDGALKTVASLEEELEAPADADTSRATAPS